MKEYHEYYPLGHIKAISLLLKNAAEFTSDQSQKLTKIDYSKYGEFGDVIYGEDFHSSVYCDAAYSHIVASSLATFFESFFSHEFHNLRSDNETYLPLNSSARWNLDVKHFWNPKKVADEHGKLKRKENIIDGTQQLMQALEVPVPIAPENWLKIQTLFHYRNYIIHNGFEWRREKIHEFHNIIQSLKVDNCFRKATSGDETWIIYMSKEFENELLDLAFELVNLFDLWFDDKIYKAQEKAIADY